VHPRWGEFQAFTLARFWLRRASGAASFLGSLVEDAPLDPLAERSGVPPGTGVVERAQVMT
jgi:hypothetical protein